MKSDHSTNIRSFVAYTSMHRRPYFFNAPSNSLIHPLLKTLKRNPYRTLIKEIKRRYGFLMNSHRNFLLSFTPIRIYSINEGSYVEIYTEEQYELIQKEMNISL